MSNAIEERNLRLAETFDYLDQIVKALPEQMRESSSELANLSKIKQSIDWGYFTYGRNKVKYEYPKWYKGGDLDDKKVTNP